MATTLYYKHLVMLRRYFFLLINLSISIGTLWAVEDTVTLAKLTTQCGRLFIEVKVLKVEPDSITIMHKDGGCRLKIEDLPLTFQKKLGMSLDDAAKAYRKERQSKQLAVQKKQLKAQEEQARRRQRAMIARIVEQQEQEFSQDAKIKVIEKHSDGYLCQVVYPMTVDITKQVTSTLGSTKTSVVGKKTIYPSKFEADLIYLVSEKRLKSGREYPLRILHVDPYCYSNKAGYTRHIEKYKVITQ
ncbi:hypothetical protein [Rubritalea sp.]|uniref:hypothetical protein n=1 Tax=Rubritalea sp. TaxID=2109375 RepID=UPI003242016D